MFSIPRRRFALCRFACLALAATMLAGCVVVPAGPGYRWHPARYYY